MNEYVYVYFKEDLLLGGTELLIERLSKNFKKTVSNIIVVTKSCVTDIRNRYHKNNIKILEVSKWNDKELKKALKSFGNFYIRAITFSIEDFCIIYSCKSNKIKTLLYTVYFNQLIIGGETKNRIALYLVKYISANILNTLLKSKNIVCMDEHTVDNTYKYYMNKLKIHREDIYYLRIPVDIVDINKTDLYDRARSNLNSILTIARADFPWKGYILGLMDYVADNWRKYNLKLHIVSYGNGEKDIKLRYNTYDVETQNRIILQSKTDYDELERLYRNTKLYIGQGTTVLDAAQRGILTIPVVPDTYQIIAEDYFDDNPFRVTVPLEIENNFNTLMSRFYSLDRDEYINKAVKGRLSVTEMYGTESVCKEINQLFDAILDNSKQNIFIKIFNISKNLKRYIRKM